VPEPAHLPGLLAWALQQPLSLLRVRTHRQRDAALRRRLRTMAGEPSGL
jgi:2-succinyl-5-enolpyruvyl-6-hydroxy-3-cyclohexene-1-carboxylate synthase